MQFANIGHWDRAVRVLVGAVLLYLGWSEALSGLWSAAARVFGFIPLATGLAGWSPLYALLGRGTRRSVRAVRRP